MRYSLCFKLFLNPFILLIYLIFTTTWEGLVTEIRRNRGLNQQIENLLPSLSPAGMEK